VDASNEEVLSTYQSLAALYNEIQAKRDAAIEEKAKRPLFQLPQINIQLPKIEMPKIEIPQIRLQSPFVFGNKKEETESLQQPETDRKGKEQ